MGTQQFCLKWNNHQANMVTIFEQLLSTEALVDVTLACDGLSLRAHKMVLSACSPYFQSLFIENPCKHPIVIMKDMRYTELKAIIDFMYRGEVNVSHDQLNALLRTAETLKVKGLAEVCGERTNSGMVQQEVVQQNATSTPVAASTHVPTRSDSPTLLSKRKRGRPRKRSLSDSNRSDDEQVPSKIKQPESPEIEELSADASLDASEVSQNIGGSNSQTHVPVSSVHNSLRTSIQPSQDPQIEEPSECEFEVEPSKLMEQTLSTDVPVISSKSATQIPSSSVHTSSSAIVPSGDSQSLISASVSIASDSLGSSQMQGPDSPQDIKPALLTFEEPPISPVAGTSQENSSMLMYVDPSGVPAIPGTSYQQDSQGAIAQQDSQQDQTRKEQKAILDDSSIPAAEPMDTGTVVSQELVEIPSEFIETSSNEVVVTSSYEAMGTPVHKTGGTQSSEAETAPSPSNEVIVASTQSGNVVLSSSQEIVVASSQGIVAVTQPGEAVPSTSQGVVVASPQGVVITPSHRFVVVPSHELVMSPSASTRYIVVSPSASHYVVAAQPSTSQEAGPLQKSENDGALVVRPSTSVVPASPEAGFHRDMSSGIYHCHHCSYSTSHKGDMNKHQRKVTGEKPFKCHVCGKGFIQSINLKHHLRIHTGEKPYECTICRRRFTQKGNILKHMECCSRDKS